MCNECLFLLFSCFLLQCEECVQSVAVCCSLLQCVAVCCNCVAVCYSMLLCAAVCGNVLLSLII